jgi:hypothetical protein
VGAICAWATVWPPSDAEFQRRIVLAALRLLERPVGAVIIEDFPDDDPRERADPDWRPPLLPPVSDAHAPAMLAVQLGAEITLLADAYRRCIADRGRTTVGLSGLSAPELGRYVGDWLCDPEPPSPPSASPSNRRMPEPNIGDRNSYGSCVDEFRTAKLRRGSRTFAQDPGAAKMVEDYYDFPMGSDF